MRPEYKRTLSRALVCFPDASGDTDPGGPFLDSSKVHSEIYGPPFLHGALCTFSYGNVMYIVSTRREGRLRPEASHLPQTSELQARQDPSPAPATGGFWARLSRVALLTRRKILELGLAAVRQANQMHAQLHLVDAPGVEVELWAQDLGEPIFLEGILA